MPRILPLAFAAAAPLALALAAAPAGAQSLSAPSGLSFDLGAGLRYAPEYVGADDSEGRPWLILRNVSFAATASGDPAEGFYVAPSANYVGKRDEGDSDRLEGLDEVDATVELGVKAGYRFGPLDAYGTVRKGFGGHKGVVAELGLQHRAPLSVRLTLTSALEAQYGNDRYMDAYFSVDDDESARSGLDAYDAGGGFRSVSASLGLRYQATENVAVVGDLRVARLVGDAADSPIVEDKEQVSVGLGVVRHFSFRF